LSSCSIYRFCCWSSNCSPQKKFVICACKCLCIIRCREIWTVACHVRYDVESAHLAVWHDGVPTEPSYSIVHLVLSQEGPSRGPVDRRTAPSPTPTNRAHAMALLLVQPLSGPSLPAWRWTPKLVQVQRDPSHLVVLRQTPGCGPYRSTNIPGYFSGDLDELVDGDLLAVVPDPLYSRKKNCMWS
jgi:hypothetical protein